MRYTWKEKVHQNTCVHVESTVELHGCPRSSSVCCTCSPNAECCTCSMSINVWIFILSSHLGSVCSHPWFLGRFFFLHFQQLLCFFFSFLFIFSIQWRTFSFSFLPCDSSKTTSVSRLIFINKTFFKHSFSAVAAFRNDNTLP